MENNNAPILTKRQQNHINWIDSKVKILESYIPQIERKEFLRPISILFHLPIFNKSKDYPNYLVSPLQRIASNLSLAFNSHNVHHLLDSYLTGPILFNNENSVEKLEQKVVSVSRDGFYTTFTKRIYTAPTNQINPSLLGSQGNILFHDFLESEIKNLNLEKYFLHEIQYEELIKKFKRTSYNSKHDLTKNGEMIIRLPLFDITKEERDIYIKPDQSDTYLVPVFNKSEITNPEYFEFHEINANKVILKINHFIKFLEEVVLRVKNNNYNELRKKLEFAANQLIEHEVIEFPSLRQNDTYNQKKTNIVEKKSKKELKSQELQQDLFSKNSNIEKGINKKLNSEKIILKPISIMQEKLENLLALFSKNHFEELRFKNEILDFNDIEDLFLIKKKGLDTLFEIVNSKTKIDEEKRLIVEKKLSFFCINSFKALNQVLKNKIRNYNKNNFEFNKAKLLELKKEIVETLIDIEISFSDEIIIKTTNDIFKITEKDFNEQFSIFLSKQQQKNNTSNTFSQSSQKGNHQEIYYRLNHAIQEQFNLAEEIGMMKLFGERGIEKATNFLEKAYPDLKAYGQSVGIENPKYLEISTALAVTASSMVKMQLSNILLTLNSNNSGLSSLEKEKIKNDLFIASSFYTDLDTYKLLPEGTQVINENKKILSEVEKKIFKSSSGCYIATHVYGSPTSPEVIQLRKFRDQTLSKSKIGQKFIIAYYRFSPKLILLFGNNCRINQVIKFALDSFTKTLKLKKYNT
ncbi:CFI-box-CTERM domain-containing protein [Algoriphagus marincola]|uniref:CFI-box-CTERM domain-containing protein n=1 Tax=Algoriphagus marincola TaxID=264027 RepID=UPI00040C4145|nr:CFI-box-CTERM domain-containing protein [Algoriphagus marincola]